MITKLQVEFETRTIGAMVLTIPVFHRLGFREIVNHYCPIGEQKKAAFRKYEDWFTS
jgi:hypothetical protein